VKKQLLIYGLIYGLCGGLLIAALKVIEYRFVVVEHSIEIYGGLTALIFAGVGIWLGCSGLPKTWNNAMLSARSLNNRASRS